MGEERAQFALEQRLALGLPIDHLQLKPELPAHLLLLWEMYQLVQNSRALGFGTIGFVPASEVKAVVDAYGIRELDLRIECLHIILALDQAYVSWWIERYGPKDHEGKKK